MIRPLVVALVLALCATGAWADPYSRGNDYLRKGEYDRAIANYTKAIALDPNDAYAYNNRGLAYRKKGEHGRAIADHSKAIALDPNYFFAYYNRGNAHKKKGDKEQAIADFRKALEIDPSFQEAKDGLKKLGVTPISAASMETDKTVAENTVETEAEPKDEPKTAKKVGCKKFFPAVGMTLTVACE